MSLNQYLFLGILGLEILMSLVTFIAYASDKKKAVQGKMRTKEKTLLGLAAGFGAPGALVGRIVAHHKTDKRYFSVVIWFSLAVQAALIVFLAYLAFIF